MIQSSYERLPVESLKIAPYQIPRLNMLRAKAIAKAFDSTRLGVVTVSKRDGIHYVVDGQHRLVASKIVGVKDLMCLVIDGMSYEEECIRFATQSENVKPVEINHKFNAFIEGKDPLATKIKSIVNSAGVELSCEKSKAQNRIIAISTIQNIYKQCGEENLFRTVKLIKDTWNGETKSFDKEILNGVSIFLKIYGLEVADKKFISQLSKEAAPIVIIREGNSDISYTTSGSYIKYAKVIWKYYNKGLREQNKLANKF
jgi:hypothetical protein